MWKIAIGSSATCLMVVLLSACQQENPDSFDHGRADCVAGSLAPQCDASGSGTSFFDGCTGDELCEFGPNCGYVNDVSCVDGMWTWTSDTGNEIVCGGIPCEASSSPEPCDVAPQCDAGGSGTAFFDGCTGEELCDFGPNCIYATDVSCVDDMWTLMSDTGNEIVCGGIPCDASSSPEPCDVAPQCDAGSNGTSFFDSCSGDELCDFGPNCGYVNDVFCVDSVWTWMSDTGNEIVCGGIPCDAPCSLAPQCDASGSGTSFFDGCSGDELCEFGPNCIYATDVSCVDGMWTLMSDTGNEIVCGGIPCN